MPPGGYTPFGMPYYRPPIMMGTGGLHPMHQGMSHSHPQNPTTAQGKLPPVPSGVHSQSLSPTPPLSGGPRPSVPPHVSVIGAPPAQSFTPPRSVASTITASPVLMATPTYAPAGVEAKPQASSTPVVSIAGESEPTWSGFHAEILVRRGNSMRTERD